MAGFQGDSPSWWTGGFPLGKAPGGVEPAARGWFTATCQRSSPPGQTTLPAFSPGPGTSGRGPWGPHQTRHRPSGRCPARGLGGQRRGHSVSPCGLPVASQHPQFCEGNLSTMVSPAPQPRREMGTAQATPAQQPPSPLANYCDVSSSARSHSGLLPRPPGTLTWSLS